MFTQPEKEYIKRLFQAQPSLTNDDVRELVNKRREKEATINTPKQKGILGKIWGGLMDVGAGGIQAGGELAVWLPGQISRLAPGDQSADQSSFYNKTQRLLEDTKKQQTEQGRDVEWVGFWLGKWIMNIAAGSVWAGLLGKWAQALANTGTATNLGTQIATKSPTLAKYGGEVIKGFTWAASKGNLAQKVIWGAATGLREWLGFWLASWQDPRSAMKTGAVIGWAIPIVAKWVWLLWKWTQKVGEKLYKSAIKPNADEARKIIQSEAGKMAKPTLRSDTALKYGISGTEKWIGVKWVREADRIFKKTINPALAKSKITHKIDDLLSDVEQQIAKEESVLRKQELMEWLQALKQDFKSTGKKIFSSSSLQAEKSSLDKFTPNKIFKWKDVAQGYAQVKSMLANVMRGKVREDLGKVWVKNAKELYRDWANLTALEDIGVKGITEGGLRGGFGTFWSTLSDMVMTPIKTVWGNTLYRAWNGIKFTWPKWIKTLWDFLQKGWLKVVWDIIQRI